MNHNFPCSPQGGKISQLNSYLLYRQNYTRWEICSLIPSPNALFVLQATIAVVEDWERGYKFTTLRLWWVIVEVSICVGLLAIHWSGQLVPFSSGLSFSILTFSPLFNPTHLYLFISLFNTGVFSLVWFVTDKGSRAEMSWILCYDKVADLCQLLQYIVLYYYCV